MRSLDVDVTVGGRSRTVTAYELDVPGLLVARWPDEEAWAVLHHSGTILGPSRWRRRKDAIQHADRIGSLADWTQDVEELRAIDSLRRRVEEAAEAMDDARQPLPTREPQKPTLTGVSYTDEYDEQRRRGL